jgi:hypothetical protein
VDAAKVFERMARRRRRERQGSGDRRRGMASGVDEAAGGGVWHLRRVDCFCLLGRSGGSYFLL